ncbi:MAG TPA: sigma-70 family RNA polymerase sigma factor [Polyangia bacterium]|nr:sigma-70 family RNA polymerase sigma factor [Polyangia bacterium]
MAVKPRQPPMFGVTAVTTIEGLLAPAKATQAEQDDAALIAAVKRSDPGSREALYHRYKRRVYGLALRIVGPVDAEEVSQEAFIRIFRGLPKFRGDAALSTWIYRLAVNAALSHRTRRGAARLPTEEGTPEVVESQPAEEPTRGDAVLRARLERALVRLPAGYRTVIVLHDVEGLEHEEIASILSCHVGTSKSQLHKARARLREILAAEGITAAALEDG